MSKVGRDGTTSKPTGQLSEADRRRLLTAIEYRWEMFQRLTQWLRENAADSPIRSAVLESLLIHGRVLLEAFYKGKEENGRRKRKGFDDDLHAGMLAGFERPELPDDLGAWKRKVNKCAAHLTSAEKESDWEVCHVAEALEKRINMLPEHLRQAPPDRPYVFAAAPPRFFEGGFGATFCSLPAERIMPSKDPKGEK